MLRKTYIVGFMLIVSLFALVACGGQESNTATNEAVEPAVQEPAIEEPVAEATTAEVTAVESDTETSSPESSTTGGMRTFKIVPDQSEASYSVKEEFFSDAVARLGVALGLTNTVGRTQEVTGELQIDLAQPSPLVAAQFEVNIQSLVSDQSRRDERIQEQYLQSAQFPLAQFTATSLEGFPENYTAGDEVTFQMLGDMTIREQTQPATFEVTAVLEGDTISGTAAANLTMTDYGFDPPVMGGFFTVEDDFIVEVVFTAQE